MSDATTQDRPVAVSVSEPGRSWLRRLPLRITVRAFMIVVLAVGGGLGWVVHLAHVQRDAIAAIRARGGHATYDWQLKVLPNGTRQFDATGRPKGPNWLLGFLGPDFVGHVDRVQLGTANRNDQLKLVGQLDRLRVIDFFSGIDFSPVVSAGLNSLPNTGMSRVQSWVRLVTTDLSPQQIDGASFKYLKHLTHLEYLNLPNDTLVTDADLAHLSRLTALLALELHDKRITNAGFVFPRGRRLKLKTLEAFAPQVSGAGLGSLRAMTQLGRIDLSQTGVDDVSAIGHLTGLTNLDLSRTPIGDDGLAPIAGLIGMTNLNLSGTNITSLSLGKLKHLSKLKVLSLARTRLADEGSAQIAEPQVVNQLWTCMIPRSEMSLCVTWRRSLVCRS